LSNTVVADLMHGSPEDQPDSYRQASPMERLPLTIPTRVIHGTADRIVPFEIGETYAAKAGEAAQLIKLEGAGHFELIDPHTEEFKIVREAILSLLDLRP
jgi:pimeloyl-ACP methyl ester carboxylesterase